MNKFVKKIFPKSQSSFIIGIILGITLTASGVYAAQSFTSKNVFYDKSSSKLSSTNVQDALDELYENAKSCFPHYAFGLPTDSSPTNFKEVISSSGSNVFVRKQGEQFSVCLYSSDTNNKLVCLKQGSTNFEANKALLNTTNFPGANCSSNPAEVECSSDSFDFVLYSNGSIDCYDNNNLHICQLLSEDEVPYCS